MQFHNINLPSFSSSTERKSAIKLISKPTVFDFNKQFGEVAFPDENKCSIKNIICFARAKSPKFVKEELDQQIFRLNKFCLVHIQDSYRVHINRLKAIDLLEKVMDRTEFSELQPLQAMSLVWCTLSCIHHFYIRLRVNSGGILAWARRRDARRVMRIYENLIRLTMPRLFDTVLHSIITFYTESKMWNTEYLCAELLKRLLHISQEGTIAVHSILDIAEKSSQHNINEARQVIRVLYQVLENYPWSEMDEYLMLRLLTMFHTSIMTENDNFEYASLRRGIEVCLRHILANLPSEQLLNVIRTMMQWTFEEQITDDALLDFGNVLEYAAMVHVTYLYRDSLQRDVFPMILEMVASENRLHSLLGNRVLQFLMDRHNNKAQFDTPKIFFDDMQFDIAVSVYNSEDKAFIRKYREMIHTTLLASIRLHGVHRINLESTYTSIAIFVVEIPCGYTAAAIVCLAMAIQEYTLSDESLDLECTHRFHATVMSIMSLVCWVHQAQVFYDYLKTVLARRAQYAPHLNPPLRSTYQYAQHHILWNKPELFFEDWEARYGLWKCFRSRRTKSTLLVDVNNDSLRSFS